MRFEDRVRVRHMLEATVEAMGFCENRLPEEMGTDRMLLLAVVRCIEIIGEAAGSVSQETRLMAPEIPWKSMTAMRNRLIHAYFDVNPEIVWKTVTVELPPLIPLMETLIKR